MTRRAIVVIGAAFVLAACGQTGTQPAAPGPSAPSAPAASDLNAGNVAGLGAVVTDAQGRTLYRFDNDTATPPVSHCVGQCAVLWPPVTGTPGSVTLNGIDQHLVGTTTRQDGTQQVTLGGWPLYRYAQDTAAGQANGEGVMGTWFAASPSGAKVTPAPSPSSPGQGYSGY